jgi:large subunit ribosomal protein LP2
MKHLAAYLLIALAGNESPSAADVKGVLSSVGIDADSERLDKLIAELQGKDLQEVSFLREISRTILTRYAADR